MPLCAAVELCVEFFFALFFFFFSSRRRHTRYWRDWSSDECSSDLDELVDRVLGEVTRGRPGGDDIALLALRAEIPDPTRFHVRLPAVPSSLPMLRHTLRRWMERSEERRVARECRCRWVPDDAKKNK